MNAQHSAGSVSLWRFRKANSTDNQYQLIASNSPESLNGWINEGSIGFVYTSIPGIVLLIEFLLLC